MLLTIAMLFCLSAFLGCTGNTDVQTKSGRVECMMDDGMIVYLPSYGYVYVKNVTTNSEIGALCTVIIEFSEENLQQESGTFQNFSGNELEYSYVLNAINSIRLADPAAGEPTYG